MFPFVASTPHGTNIFLIVVALQTTAEYKNAFT